jgi:hypothetical protein
MKKDGKCSIGSVKNACKDECEVSTTYNGSLKYPGTNSDNYYNWCQIMKKDGKCSIGSVKNACKDECGI